ncbi:MAG: MopE-related protein [bacterium]
MIAKRISWLALALLAGCTGDFPSYPADAGGDASPPEPDALLDAEAEADDGRPPADAARGDAAGDATPPPPDAGLCSEEKCNGDDDDCDGRIDEGVGRPCWPFSEDVRGVGRCMDGVETCRDGAWVGDCTGAIGPVDEVCNGVDEDCDGRADEAPRPCYDGPPGTEGVGRCAPGAEACTRGVWSGQCEAAVVPGEETCDGTDEDCDGHIDEAVDGCDPDPDDDQVLGGEDNCPAVFNPDQADADGDGAGDACDDDDDGDGALDADDCQPFDPTRFPGAAERCDGADDDCDGAVDEGADRACYDGPAGTEGIGACHAGVQRCIDAAYGPCEGARGPVDERCDGQDEDCDGAIDEGLSPGWIDADGDGFGDGLIPPVCPAQQGMAVVPGDCDDGDAQIAPGQADPLDEAGVDADCDGVDGEADRLIFVAPDGDDAGDGSPDHPLQSLPAALDRAARLPDPQGVVVGAGRYPGGLSLRAGVHLFGGYDRAAGWARQVTSTTTLHAEGAVDHLIGVLAVDLDVPTQVADLAITTADAAVPGGSTYGVVARRAPGLRLLRVAIAPGAAAAGSPGVAGAPGAAGGPGGRGGDCGGDPGGGGASACARAETAAAAATGASAARPAPRPAAGAAATTPPSSPAMTAGMGAAPGRGPQGAAAAPAPAGALIEDAGPGPWGRRQPRRRRPARRRWRRRRRGRRHLRARGRGRRRRRRRVRGRSWRRRWGRRGLLRPRRRGLHRPERPRQPPVPRRGRAWRRRRPGRPRGPRRTRRRPRRRA